MTGNYLARVRRETILLNCISVVLVIGIVAMMVVLRLWAFDWDYRCLIAECRIMK